MKTDDLIHVLATGVEPVPRGGTVARFAGGTGIGTAGALLITVMLLGFRPDMREAAHLPMFWMKLAFPLAVAAGAWGLATRLAQPGRPVGLAPFAVTLPFALVALGAVTVLAGAASEDRLALVTGRSWVVCSLFVAMASVPAFAAAMWVLAGLAPTRLRLAGFAAGLLAGGIGAAAYSLHCDEMAVPFLAIWYTLGMLLPAAVGALAGPRWIRW